MERRKKEKGKNGKMERRKEGRNEGRRTEGKKEGMEEKKEGQKEGQIERQERKDRRKEIEKEARKKNRRIEGGHVFGVGLTHVCSPSALCWVAKRQFSHKSTACTLQGHSSVYHLLLPRERSSSPVCWAPTRWQANGLT